MEITKECVISPKGKKKAVILPIEEYKKLLEDIHDLAIIVERKKEKAIKLDNFLTRMRENGYL